MTVAAEPLLCPMCDYDLRGQVEPRCPECGYRFDFDELRDPSRRMHPYLFEHHPRRNMRSLVRTLLGGFRPKRFWSRLTPQQPASLRRLLLYHVLSIVPTVLAFALTLAATAVYAWQNERNLGQWGRFATARWYEYVAEAWRDLIRDPLIWTGAFAIAWPWLTFAALLIFQFSMRRARVRNIHALRCVLYSGDVLFLVGMTLLLFASLWAAEVYRGKSHFNYDLSVLIITGIILLCALMFTWRLRQAIAHYLRLDRPTAVAVTTQIIVTLLMFIGVLWLSFYTTSY